MMASVGNGGVSVRPGHRPYRPYEPVESGPDKIYPGGPKLQRQMAVGFTFAALLGVTMLMLGSVFLKDAIESDFAISVMLCILGIVCGLIIVVGTGILGKVFICRKFRQTEDVQPPQQCFHTCSIVYTPSQDQLAYPAPNDLPPSYESIAMSQLPHAVLVQGETANMVEASMTLPPQYSDIDAPLPSYGETV